MSQGAQIRGTVRHFLKICFVKTGYTFLKICISCSNIPHWMLYRGHMCRQNVLFRKLNICVGVLIFPSQGASVSPIVSRVNIALRRFLHNNGNIATERSPKLGLSNYFRGSLFLAQYYRHHCTLQAFEQLGALYMHNLDDTRGMTHIRQIRTQYLWVLSHN